MTQDLNYLLLITLFTPLIISTAVYIVYTTPNTRLNISKLQYSCYTLVIYMASKHWFLFRIE